MTNPTFTPGMEVWHVRHGKVILAESTNIKEWVVARKGQVNIDTIRLDGKVYKADFGRVLYTLDEARQYGWLKEPRVVEFEASVTAWTYEYGTNKEPFGDIKSPLLFPLGGKRVRVIVEEIP